MVDHLNYIFDLKKKVRYWIDQLEYVSHILHQVGCSGAALKIDEVLVEMEREYPLITKSFTEEQAKSFKETQTFTAEILKELIK